jgi:hypothetical protein
MEAWEQTERRLERIRQLRARQAQLKVQGAGVETVVSAGRSIREQWIPTAPVGKELAQALAQELERQGGDIASEALWQAWARLCLEYWEEMAGRQMQLRMATLMQQVQTILKIRMTMNRPGGGTEQLRRLQAYQQWMDDIFSGADVTAPPPTAAEESAAAHELRWAQPAPEDLPW